MLQILPNEIHSLWIGDRLGPLEHLCLRTWIEQGHRAVLWRYEPLQEALPDGVEIRDAPEIVDRKELVAHRKTGNWALGSDLFRFKLLTKRAVTWCDLDVFLLKPLDMASAHLFGWEHATSINCAVLRAPPNSALLRDLVDLNVARVPIPPWAPLSRKLYYRLRSLLGIARTKQQLEWGTFGPRALTYFTAKHGLQNLAAPTHVYYPVPCEQAHSMLAPGTAVEDFFKPDSVAVHIWGSHVRYRIMAGDFAADSWFARQCERHGVSVQPA